MDDFARNNWIVVIIIAASIILITTNIFLFNGMILSVADNIDHTVDSAASNMTMLTHTLIAATREDTNLTLSAVNKFTDIMAEYSKESDINLDNISSLLTHILRGEVLASTKENTALIYNLSDIVTQNNEVRAQILNTSHKIDNTLNNISRAICGTCNSVP